MQLTKPSWVYVSVLAFLAISSLASAAGIPVKHPSGYGIPDGQTALTTPSFTPISQDGVSIDLNSVFCSVNDCAGDPTNAAGQSLTYFFSINLTAGSQLNSLIFGPDFNDFGVVVFDSSFDTLCASGSSYICSVPVSAAGLDFSTVQSVNSCTASGCTVTFTNFDFATLGSGTIIFAATTPENSSLNPSGTPLSPTVTANTSGGTSVAVPEPGSLVLLAFAGLACLGGIAGRKRLQLS